MSRRAVLEGRSGAAAKGSPRRTGGAGEAELVPLRALTALGRARQLLRAGGSSVVPELPSGTMLGPYHVRGLLGRGGMGLVYLAEHVELRRRDALKVVRPDRLNRPTPGATSSTRPAPPPAWTTPTSPASTTPASPSAQFVLAAGGDSGRVVVWETAGGRAVHDWRLPARVAMIAVTPDGRQLVAGCRNGAVYLLRLASGN